MTKRRHTAKRRSSILKALEKYQEVSVYELSRLHKVSEVTIRNDLNILHKQNLLTRTQGGAVGFIKEATKTKVTALSPVLNSLRTYIKDGQTLLLSGGIHSNDIGDLLNNKKRLTIITNSLSIANSITGINENKLIVPGGTFSFDHNTLIDDSKLREFFCDLCILEVDGIDVKKGLFVKDPEIAKQKKVMIQMSDYTILLTNQKQFQQKTPYRIAGLNEINILISKDKLDQSLKRQIRDQEVQILQVT